MIRCMVHLLGKDAAVSVTLALRSSRGRGIALGGCCVDRRRAGARAVPCWTAAGEDEPSNPLCVRGMRSDVGDFEGNLPPRPSGAQDRALAAWISARFATYSAPSRRLPQGGRFMARDLRQSAAPTVTMAST